LNCEKNVQGKPEAGTDKNRAEVRKKASSAIFSRGETDSRQGGKKGELYYVTSTRDDHGSMSSR